VLVCDAFDGAIGAEDWTVVTVLVEELSPPAAAITAATTAPPTRAATKGMTNVRFMEFGMEGRLNVVSGTDAVEQFTGSPAAMKAI